MEETKDGPQSATRHYKIRRPVLRTRSARAVARLEERLSIVENGHSNTLQQTSSPRRSIIAAELDADLNNFGEMYNGHEERIVAVEQKLNSIIEKLQPYELYKKQAMDAVDQLKTFNDRMTTARRNQAVPIADHVAALPLSTPDLAHVLVQRLTRGEVLDEPTIAKLRQALDPTTNITTARLPDTPVTDEAEATANEVEASIEDEDEPPRKRRRHQATHRNPKVAKGQGQLTAASPVKANNVPENGTQAAPSQPEIRTRQRHLTSQSPLKASNALESFAAGRLGASESVELGDVVIPPEEPRRTSRVSKKTESWKDMCSWKEANKTVKGLRRSGG